MLTSTRRSLAYPNPNRSDTADVPRDIGVIIAALELDVVFGQGTHAARPAAGAGAPAGTGGGRLYWETDTSGLFYDTGSAWVGPINTSAIGPGTITQAMLAKPSVGAPEIIDGSVGSAELAAGSVTAVKIAAALFPSQGAGAGTEALRAIGSSAGQVAAGNDPRFPTYGTSLPGSPTDGQEFMWTDSLTSPTWTLRLRWNNSSTTGYRWEVIGTMDIGQDVAAPGGLGGTGSYASITGTPSVAVPRTGLYDVFVGGDLRLQRGGGGFFVAPNGAGLTANDAQAIRINEPNSGDNPSSSVQFDFEISMLKKLTRQALTGGQAVTLYGKYNAGGSTSRSLSNLHLSIRPVFLS